VRRCTSFLVCICFPWSGSLCPQAQNLTVKSILWRGSTLISFLVRSFKHQEEACRMKAVPGHGHTLAVVCGTVVR